MLVDGGKFVTNDAILENTISGEKITQINDTLREGFWNDTVGNLVLKEVEMLKRRDQGW